MPGWRGVAALDVPLMIDRIGNRPASASLRAASAPSLVSNGISSGAPPAEPGFYTVLWSPARSSSSAAGVDSHRPASSTPFRAGCRFALHLQEPVGREMVVAVRWRSAAYSHDKRITASRVAETRAVQSNGSTVRSHRRWPEMLEECPS